jgi:hypothetical protein
MQKKYFPSPSKQSTKKLNQFNKKVKRRWEIIQKNNGKSLRKEFDLIMKLNYRHRNSSQKNSYRLH